MLHKQGDDRLRDGRVQLVECPNMGYVCQRRSETPKNTIKRTDVVGSNIASAHSLLSLLALLITSVLPLLY